MENIEPNEKKAKKTESEKINAAIGWVAVTFYSVFLVLEFTDQPVAISFLSLLAALFLGYIWSKDRKEYKK